MPLAAFCHFRNPESCVFIRISAGTLDHRGRTLLKIHFCCVWTASEGAEDDAGLPLQVKRFCTYEPEKWILNKDRIVINTLQVKIWSNICIFCFTFQMWYEEVLHNFQNTGTNCVVVKKLPGFFFLGFLMFYSMVMVLKPWWKHSWWYSIVSGVKQRDSDSELPGCSQKRPKVQYFRSLNKL